MPKSMPEVMPETRPETRGHCLCRAVTWSSNKPANWAGICHCHSCRRANAASMVGYIAFPNDGLTISGPVSIHASSAGTERGFCATCHTPLFYRSPRWPDETHMMSATLDAPEDFEPKAHFHWAEREPWLKLDDDLPKFDTTAGSDDDA